MQKKDIVYNLLTLFSRSNNIVAYKIKLWNKILQKNSTDSTESGIFAHTGCLQFKQKHDKIKSAEADANINEARKIP